jgi:Trk K+ transport system NAD-binding subunit
MAKDKFLIIGFGRFGESLLDTLLSNKSEVMIIDNNPDKIKKIQSKVENSAIIAFSTLD